MLPELKKFEIRTLEEKEWCALLTSLIFAYWGISVALCAFLVLV